MSEATDSAASVGPVGASDASFVVAAILYLLGGGGDAALGEAGWMRPLLDVRLGRIAVVAAAVAVAWAYRSKRRAMPAGLISGLWMGVLFMWIYPPLAWDFGLFRVHGALMPIIYGVGVERVALVLSCGVAYSLGRRDGAVPPRWSAMSLIPLAALIASIMLRVPGARVATGAYFVGTTVGLLLASRVSTGGALGSWARRLHPALFVFCILLASTLSR